METILLVEDDQQIALLLKELLERIWDDEAFVDENTLNVNITRVRKRLTEIGIGGLETVRGVGYKLVLDK